MRRFDNVIWDFDGTLLDTYPVIAESMREALAELGAAESHETVMARVRETIGGAARHFAAAHGLDADALMERYHAVAAGKSPDLSPPFPGIPALLADLRSAGTRSYIFTHRGQSLPAYLKHFGLADLFADVVTWSDRFRRKPDPSGNLYIIETHGLDPARSIAVGDRELDVLAGKRAGTAACLFTEGRGRAESAADFQADTVEDIRRVLLDGR